MIIIKEFEADDRDEVIGLALYFQNDGSRPQVTIEDQPDMLHIRKNYFDNGGGFWVAKDDGKVVGTIGLMRYTNEIAVLKKFFVYEKYQGNPEHLGQKLYKVLIDFAKQQNLKTIILDTPRNTTRAHRFYEMAGFKKISKKELPIKYHYPIAECDFFMLRL